MKEYTVHSPKNWYFLEKYSRNSENALENVCKFLILDGQICYYTEKSYLEPYDLWVNSDLNLPVPFKQGDFISVNCEPFAEIKKALVLEIGDNWDCCSVQIAFIEDDRIKTGALKHADQIFGWILSIRMSPLYSVEKCEKKELGYKNENLCELQFILKDYANSVKRDLAYEKS